MKKTDPWKLAVILLGLVLIFIAVRKFRSPMLEGNLPVTLAEIDTADVTELIITPAKARQQPIRMTKAGGWKLINGEQTLRLEQGAGPNMLRVLTTLKPERMVTKREEKWDEYSVGDSSGTRIQVMAGSATEADLIIGRSGFTPPQNQGYGGSGFTYIRIHDEAEVYAVTGFLEAQFNRALDEWRDKSFTRIKMDSVTDISFRYPGDSSFVVQKVNGTWTSNTRLVDSVAVKAYLSGLEYRNAAAFAATAPVGSPAVVMTLSGKGKVRGTLEAWPGEGTWIVRSSQQPETFFALDAAARKDVFVGPGRFVTRP